MTKEELDSALTVSVPATIVMHMEKYGKHPDRTKTEAAQTLRDIMDMVEKATCTKSWNAMLPESDYNTGYARGQSALASEIAAKIGENHD